MYYIENADAIVMLAVEYRSRGVVAVDIAGDETLPMDQRFIDAFHMAKKHGLHITVHAGESGPANVKEVNKQLVLYENFEIYKCLNVIYLRMSKLAVMLITVWSSLHNTIVSYMYFKQWLKLCTDLLSILLMMNKLFSLCKLLILQTFSMRKLVVYRI